MICFSCSRNEQKIVVFLQVSPISYLCFIRFVTREFSVKVRDSQEVPKQLALPNFLLEYLNVELFHVTDSLASRQMRNEDRCSRAGFGGGIPVEVVR